jgi:hypothetical protein
MLGGQTQDDLQKMLSMNTYKTINTQTNCGARGCSADVNVYACKNTAKDPYAIEMTRIGSQPPVCHFRRDIAPGNRTTYPAICFADYQRQY